eukprot:gene4628-7658_t
MADSVGVEIGALPSSRSPRGRLNRSASWSEGQPSPSGHAPSDIALSDIASNVPLTSPRTPRARLMVRRDSDGSFGDPSDEYEMQSRFSRDAATPSVGAWCCAGLGARLGALRDAARGCRCRHVALCLQAAIPILRWLPEYNSTLLRQDLASGVTVGVVLVPQGLAYAMLADLPPIYGLYAALAPLPLYAAL